VPQAKRLRANMTGAEAALWKLLRGRGFERWKFRRQTPIGPYVADFCCYELRLVVELDGGVHVLREQSDAVRDADLTARGFTVLRFSNEAMLSNPNLVFDAIRRHAAQPPPHPSGSA
jgi:very-short-patch-repair endonuclease